MIKLQFEGMCEGCTKADIEVDYVTVGCIGENKKIWIVKCTNEEICESWHRMLEENGLERMDL